MYQARAEVCSSGWQWVRITSGTHLVVDHLPVIVVLSEKAEELGHVRVLL
jgi:hypothetical protein